MKTCSDCGAKFTPRGRRSHRCEACQNAYEKKAAEMYRGTAKVRGQMIAASPYCPECGTTDTDILVIDHIIPIAKGGTNDPDNLRVMCSLCNDHKGAR